METVDCMQVYWSKTVAYFPSFLGRFLDAIVLAVTSNFTQCVALERNSSPAIEPLLWSICFCGTVILKIAAQTFLN